MNCSEVTREIPLYCYGEVSAEAEERIESHIADCTACRRELDRHRVFLDRVDMRHDPVDASLLTACRASLRTALQSNAHPESHNWLDWLWNVSRINIPFRVPVGAMALIAVGFFAARYTPQKFGGVEAGVAEPMFSNIRSVQPNASGKVDIAVDEVRRHVVSGKLQDPDILALLLTAAREESNPGVRVESVRLLNNSADSGKVREALISVVKRDPNAAVRLKALEGLKQYAGDVAVRRTLADVLLKDDNPDVRMQAIDLLTSRRDDSIVGVLQNAVQKEDNNYVRARCSRVLEEMKASVGTY